MDLVMLALLRFTGAYCCITWPGGVRAAVYVVVGLDALQLLANIFTGHAFGIEMIEVSGLPYYRLVPYLGQTVHRVVDYGILAAVLFELADRALYKTKRSGRKGVTFFSDA